MRRFWIGWLVVLLCGLQLAACGLAGGAPVATPTSAPTETVTPEPSATASPVVECAYVWSNRELPDVARQVAQAFSEAGLPVDVQASAYGENCLDTQTNAIVRFTTMQTDFFLNVPVQDTANMVEMGEWVENIMRVLNRFPPGQVPGPNPGYIGISFIDGTSTVSLYFPRARAESLVQEGLSGAELFQALEAQ